MEFESRYSIGSIVNMRTVAPQRKKAGTSTFPTPKPPPISATPTSSGSRHSLRLSQAKAPLVGPGGVNIVSQPTLSEAFELEAAHAKALVLAEKPTVVLAEKTTRAESEKDDANEEAEEDKEDKAIENEKSESEEGKDDKKEEAKRK